MHNRMELHHAQSPEGELCTCPWRCIAHNLLKLHHARSCGGATQKRSCVPSVSDGLPAEDDPTWQQCCR
jgi:hypothetical protein